MIFKCAYGEIAPLGDGFIRVEKRNFKTGIYDISGNAVIKSMYDGISYLDDLGIFVCETEEESGAVIRSYYDTGGNFLGN